MPFSTSPSTTRPSEAAAVQTPGQPLERLPGWEARLAAVLAAARAQAFGWGQHDCFLFAAEDVQALTGHDVAAPWRGRYRTQRGALRHIAAYGGTFTGAFTRLFGAEPVPVAQARRGDVADLVRAGVHHLGVVSGAHVAFLGEQGIIMVPRSQTLQVWRIG